MTQTPSLIGWSLILLATVSLAGCGQPGVHGTSTSSRHWRSDGDDAIPGIDEAYVSFITLKAGPPEGVTFVIWSDLSKVAGGRGGGGGWKGAYKEGHLLGPDEEEKKRRKGVRSLFRIFFLMSPVGSRHS